MLRARWPIDRARGVSEPAASSRIRQPAHSLTTTAAIAATKSGSSIAPCLKGRCDTSRFLGIRLTLKSDVSAIEFSVSGRANNLAVAVHARPRRPQGRRRV